MGNSYTHIATAIISFIVGALLINKCGVKHSQQSIITSDTLYIHDTTIRVLKTHVLNVIRDTIIIPEKVDTIEAINNYYTQRVFVDSLIDSCINITIIDTILNCDLKRHTLRYTLLKPNKIVTVTSYIKKPYNALYAGVFFNTNNSYGITTSFCNEKIGVNFGIDLKNRSKTVSFCLKIPLF